MQADLELQLCIHTQSCVTDKITPAVCGVNANELSLHKCYTVFRCSNITWLIEKRAFYYKGTESEVIPHKHSLIVLLWNISCLQLHSHIPFPASVCTMNSGPTPLWVLGTQGGQWISFRFAVVKKARCRRGPPPTSTLILHGCAFSHWLNQWQETKGQVSFFSSLPKEFFFFFLGLLKVQTSEGKWPLTSPFWTRLSLSLRWCEGYGKGRRSASLSV